MLVVIKSLKHPKKGIAGTIGLNVNQDYDEPPNFNKYPHEEFQGSTIHKWHLTKSYGDVWLSCSWRNCECPCPTWWDLQLQRSICSRLLEPISITINLWFHCTTMDYITLDTWITFRALASILPTQKKVQLKRQVILCEIRAAEAEENDLMKTIWKGCWFKIWIKITKANVSCHWFAIWLHDIWITSHWKEGWINYTTLESILPTQKTVQLKRQVIYVKQMQRKRKKRTTKWQ